MEQLGQLFFSKLKFTIQTTQPMILPLYKGSTFRGAFGNLFKHTICINRSGFCESCILTKNCSYYYVFETPNTLNLSWFSSPKLPHPFVIEPPLTDREYFEIGETICFNLILIGKAIEYLPYFIFVFDEIGSRTGLGKKRREKHGRFKLCKVGDALNHNKLIYSGDEKILQSDLKIEPINSSFERTVIDELELTFITPTRIKHNNKYLFLHKNKEFPVAVFLENICRRIYLLSKIHCFDMNVLTKEAYLLREDQLLQFLQCNKEANEFKLSNEPDIELKRIDLEWFDWERYSNRQEQKQQYGGFVGQVTLQGKLDQWLPILKAGEMLHVGSGTAFGLGQYVLSKPLRF